MASKPRLRHLRDACNCIRRPRTATTIPIRSFATEAPVAAQTNIESTDGVSKSQPRPTRQSNPLKDDAPILAPPPTSLRNAFPVPEHLRPPNVLTTLYAFPTLEPIKFLSYPSSHLHLPLRKDLLHRAVVFEADADRQGTASTKWRSEVHGSGRKIRPQKGTGSARLGDKKSPMLRGGGVAFGPKPRDFSTDLPRKIYDLAMRTALSYRFRRGQLVVVQDHLDIPVEFAFGEDGSKEAQLFRELDDRRIGHITDVTREILQELGWGRNDGGSTFVTRGERKNLALGIKELKTAGQLITAEDVEIRDLLKMKRVVMEQSALNYLLRNHQSDINPYGGFLFEPKGESVEGETA
ncbi:ribosomal protein L4 [Eremomyces bilateralis CBS 781.70]|uniref:Large ribosomal subunit protein uL4m n=1 Tax=Eremomyces bilateralis CBS 781.70 TaxID=1392243 RepID=A0A6G1GA80_9PEZI|nr:ribosomal protein L4 [Eremomyces bilateralis CBS 781.70]KAF1814943.1 ribosomal protein L4 [Eremomyces bilateralis CBS 781.70]